MAEITAFLLSDTLNNSVDNQGNVIQQLTNPSLVIRPQHIPGNFSFVITAGITGVDLSKDFSFCFMIQDPENKIVYNSGKTNFSGISKEDSLPLEQQGFLINIDVRNLEITCEGKYKFIVYLNDNLIGEKIIPIYVRG